MFRKYLALLLLFALVAAQDSATGFDDEEDLAEDGADDFEEDAEEALDEGDEPEEEVEDAEEAVEGAEATAEEPVAAEISEPEDQGDLWVLLVGISSVVGVVWWLVFSMFVYIETSTADNTMCTNSDCTNKIVPVAWFWNSTNHTSLNWTALAYLFAWIFYLVISVPEFIFWVMVLAKTELENNLAPWLFNMWASYPGLYGGWILYLLPWVFFAVQLSALKLTEPGYINAAVHLAVWLVSWLFVGIVHTLGFEHINKKFEREYGHKPNVIPTAPVEEVAAPVEEEAPAEDPPAEDDEEEPLDDEEEEEEEEADDAFQSTW